MATTLTTTTHDDPPEAPANGTARWARLAALGFLMVGLGPIVLLTAALLWGLDVGDSLVMLAVSIIFGIGASFLVRRPRTLWRVLAMVAGFLGAGMVFWTVFGLFTPNSVFDFVPGTLVMPGLLIGLVAGIAAIRAQKRGATTEAAVGGERHALHAIPVAIGVLAVVSAVLTVATRETVSDADADAADVTVDMTDFEFDADSYDISGGGTILVKNSDPFSHTFNVDALDIDVTVTPGSETLVVVPAEPGDYVLYCKPHTSDPEAPESGDMASRLNVS